MDCNLSSSSNHGISQARLLEWVAIPFSRGLSQPRSKPGLLHCRQTLYHMIRQGSPISYIVHGILQARILEWIAFPSSKKSSQPRD